MPNLSHIFRKKKKTPLELGMEKADREFKIDQVSEEAEKCRTESINNLEILRNIKAPTVEHG